MQERLELDMDDDQQLTTGTTLETSQQPKKRTFVEEVEVSGNNLVERFKDLAKDANTRRVVIKTKDGKELMSVPLTIGVVAGGLVAWAAPLRLLTALSALAGVVSGVKLEVTREEDREDTPST